MIDRSFSIAPMLDWTDRHERYFLRSISRHVFLYTEMVTTGAILFGDGEKHLRFNKAEHPVALQLGGADPDELSRCAKMAEQMGYDEINLNVGCPSDRVKSGNFGACLMMQPRRVADCVAAMKSRVSIPVTVKHRVSVDNHDTWEHLCEFIETVSAQGCDVFIVHARKAWLQGLSPKQNRDIPPLQYAVVHRLKSTYPEMQFIINGGFKTLAEARAQLGFVDGVMMGREAYHNPYILAQVDRLFFNDPHEILSRRQILENIKPYIECELEKGTRLNSITRHIMGLFHGEAGARLWRRYLGENATKKGADWSVVVAAAEQLM
jgi:tRNA-dihydrouridine synthase A